MAFFTQPRISYEHTGRILDTWQVRRGVLHEEGAGTLEACLLLPHGSAAAVVTEEFHKRDSRTLRSG